MTADIYLRSILIREAVDTGWFSPARGVQAILMPTLNVWGNRYLRSVAPTGSFAKGTGNKSSTDIDLFISLGTDTPETLKQIHDSLANTLRGAGYVPHLQNVSINVTVNGYKVDLVPGKLQNELLADHSLYRRKADTWTKTNVLSHIQYVLAGGRLEETRILKLWRDQKGLDFPSFYIEMVVIEALRGDYSVTLAERVWKVLAYLRDQFANSRFVDPANTNNVISDDLSAADKDKIKNAATHALTASNWSQIVA